MTQTTSTRKPRAAAPDTAPTAASTDAPKTKRTAPRRKATGPRRGRGDFGPAGLRVPIAEPGPTDRKTYGLKIAAGEPWKVRDTDGVLHNGRAANVTDDAGTVLELRSWSQGPLRRRAWFAVLPSEAETPEPGTRIAERYTVVAAPAREKAKRKPSPKAAAAPGAEAEAPRGARVFGKYSKSAVLRALGLAGWKPAEAKAVLASLGVEVVSTGPMGNTKTKAAELTTDELRQLNELREAV